MADRFCLGLLVLKRWTGPRDICCITYISQYKFQQQVKIRR
jgi:hypothetical protein